MTNLTNDPELVRCDLTGAAARLAGVPKETVFAFGELSEFLEEFLNMFCRPGGTLVSAGLVTPEIALAADRADVKLVEVCGESPFTIDLELTLSSVADSADVLYAANPNRITGASLTVDDLRQMLEAVPDGFLIIDETLCDYSGVTAKSLLEERGNVIILRSFTAPFGMHSSDAGFSIAPRRLNARMLDTLHLRTVSGGVREGIVAAIRVGQAVGSRRQQIHDESLRLAVTLTGMGIQCRISATDFLLMRVASPKDAGNFLVSQQVPVENLDGYPGMQNYLRYRLSSPSQNDQLLDAFARMPAQHIKLASFDGRAVTLHRRKASSVTPTSVRRPIPRSALNRVRERATSSVVTGK